MLDVHPPHETPHGWRDFLIHLFTITIGLLIALSLEGCVEWQHHRHLVHDAEASLNAEVASNAKGLPDMIADLHKEQATLKQDVAVLNVLIKSGKLPEHSSIAIDFHIRAFDGVSWKTAQTTGALAYMPYDRAQQYAQIYSTQEELAATEQQAARDTIISLGPFINTTKGDPDPTAVDGISMKEKIEVLQGQLLLVDSFVNNLDSEYKQFLATHPK